MSTDLSKKLVVGVSSSALFNLEKEDKIFREKKISEYRKYQLKNEDKLLEKGTAFPLVESLLNLNNHTDESIIEVVVMSRNSPETGVRVLKAIEHYQLSITRLAFSGGEPLAPYIDAFHVDLFLSRDENDVQKIIDTAKCATGVVYPPPKDFVLETDRVKIAFDADAVIFSEDSEIINKKEGIDAFHKNEKENENVPLKEGPFAKLIKRLSDIQEKFPEEKENSPLRIAIVTARNAPSHMRVINTLRNWDVYVDEAYFLGGVPKDEVLAAFGAHIFFDDQDANLKDSSKKIPCVRVPYGSNSEIKKL